jgi:hypothetical protein
VAEEIIAEEDGESIQKCLVEFEEANTRLTASEVEM